VAYWIGHPITTPSLNHLLHQPITTLSPPHPLDQSTHHSINHPSDQSTNSLIHHLPHQPTGTN
jgi:hypothetical protein